MHPEPATIQATDHAATSPIARDTRTCQSSAKERPVGKGRGFDLTAAPWQRPAVATAPSKALETFDNPRPGRRYEIRFDCPEFTCLCPKTGQPDFATIRIRYVPDQRCVELKSLKLYLWSFRDEGAFHEAVVNQILDDLVAATAPAEDDGGG